ncbi:unnamed protein product [Vitrella brassicaformis CCMP3155]|uniref:Major facilitator superfamily (MFS) profile domain-containing protein n=1 Tax=Vitrella brassicaformis (strain CCMP3155) TaxID=1169540 RepID=A0A0G4EIW4_VITBC|nr:unnamed protein product [Vitrella brassicaformis CCMP3155]|mmetsp:Transcript_7491/g.18287  ORF Transcript_7491/g.18287 Transcript_7491/m.18287 type:complete len:465 (-) Transcript_7491:446-1840(-)|eukprot:CEL96955.1 unnamed protein product [Vitrella brassicaformis CCMP3155]
MDSWRHWWVVLASWVVGFWAIGTLSTLGVFLPYLLDEFDGNKGATSIIFAVRDSSFLIFSVLHGALVHRYWGFRRTAVVGSIIAASGLFLASYARGLLQLCLTYGLMTGFGLGMVYIPATSIISHYYHRHRATAFGIVSSGNNIGALVLAPVLDWLLQTGGWRITFTAQALACGSMLLLASLFLRLPSDKDHESDIDDNTSSSTRDGVEGEELYRALSDDAIIWTSGDDIESQRLARQRTLLSCLPECCDAPFAILYMGVFFGSLAFFPTLLYWPSFGQMTLSLSASSSAWTVTAYGAAGTIARPLLGLVADRLMGRTPLLVVCSLVMAVAIALLSIASSLTHLMLFSVLFGVVSGSLMAMCPNILADRYGAQLFPITLGVLQSSYGTATLIGPPLMGFLADAMGSYRPTFGAASACMFVASVCFAAFWLVVRRREAAARRLAETRVEDWVWQTPKEIVRARLI